MLCCRLGNAVLRFRAKDNFHKRIRNVASVPVSTE